MDIKETTHDMQHTTYLQLYKSAQNWAGSQAGIPNTEASGDTFRPGCFQELAFYILQ